MCDAYIFSIVGCREITRRGAFGGCARKENTFGGTTTRAGAVVTDSAD